MSHEWHERAVCFGPNRAMVGVVTSPTGATSETVVLLLNAGVIHRVGPNRINVLLARDMAGLGLTVLRFDQSGLGDSAPRESETDLQESVAADLADAMAYLTEHHAATRFILVGICSGARAALRTAYRAPNIAGLIVIDPPVYKTTKAVVSHYGQRLLRAESWKNALTGKNERIKDAIGRLRSRGDETHPDAPQPSTMPGRLPEWPSQSDMAAALKRMLGNGTAIHWIYTGGAEDDQYNYRDQLADTFPTACASSLMDWELMSDVDHDFATEPSRRAIRTELRAWLTRRKFS